MSKTSWLSPLYAYESSPLFFDPSAAVGTIGSFATATVGAENPTLQMTIGNAGIPLGSAIDGIEVRVIGNATTTTDLYWQMQIWDTNVSNFSKLTGRYLVAG